MTRAEINWSRQKLWTAEAIIAERARLNELEHGRWGRAIEVETKRRIKLCVATYAYEIADAPIMSDGEWDRLAQEINPRLGTCYPLVDEFFAAHFSPMTGMWIHSHPELEKVKMLYERTRS